MPRIPDNLLDCVIYLYPSRADAKAGERAGACGFLVGWPSAVVKTGTYIYAVTNDHVIGGAGAIRLNTRDGKTDILEVNPDNWKRHPNADDIAVLPLGDLVPDYYEYTLVPTTDFITPDLIAQHNIGPGDETVLVGRFISHDGRQRNTPSVRFGNIAMMPVEPVWVEERGVHQESFLVETRSIGGYSGSPVLVYIPPFAVRPDEGLKSAFRGPWLLGVDWGHFPFREKVRREGEEGLPVDEGYWVQGNTGMMGVVPAWKIMDILGAGEVAEHRERQERQLKEQLGKSADTALDSADESADDGQD